MADLVNSTHKERLSPKNSEPSHLKGGSYETLGGPGEGGASGGDAYKIDSAKGIGTDTTIPKSVGAEPTHLTKTEETDEPEVSFDGDVEDLPESDDELDRQLDEFESTDPVEVDVELGGDDDEIKEETDAAEKLDQAKDDAKDDELKEEDENPFAKKDDDEKIEEELGAEPSHLPAPGQHDGPGGIPSLGEEDENPFAKKDDEGKEEKIEESLKIRIKLPQAKLFESANMSAKTQKKVGVVFEQAVRETTKQIASQVHAHYKKLHEQKLAQRDAVMAKQMDSYLTYVVEEWSKANRVQLRQSLRAQLAEEFMSALKQVFVEHYIDVPESKVDVVAKLTEDVRKLRRSLNEQHASKLKLRKLAEAANKARIVAESSRGMSEASAAKLQKLAEDTQYTTAKDFREKVALLKESYFPKGAPKLTQKLEEDVQEPAKQESKTVAADPDVNAIAQTLSRQATQSKW